MKIDNIMFPNKGTGILLVDPSLKVFDKIDGHFQAFLFACVCMLGLKKGQKYTTDQIIIIDQEHTLYPKSIQELKDYVKEFGPDFLKD